MNHKELVENIEGVTIEFTHEKILKCFDGDFLDSIREETEQEIRCTWGPAGVLEYELWRHDLSGYWNEHQIMLRPEGYYYEVPATYSVQTWFQVFKDASKNRTRRGTNPTPTIKDEIPNPLPDPIVLQIRDGIVISKTLIHTLTKDVTPSITQTTQPPRIYKGKIKTPFQWKGISKPPCS